MTTETSNPAIQPITFRHETMPDWGVGLLLHDIAPHWILYFENAGEKKFVKDKAKVLVPVAVDAKQLATLKARASGRKPKAAPLPSVSLRPASRKPSARKAAAPRFTTFAQQVALFETLFEGGFQGESFTNDERKAKDEAIALAQETLSKEAFASVPKDELFTRACKVLSSTNIVFPIEGPIPFKQLAGADREKALAGLEGLLHGTGSLGERIERFTASLTLKDGKGTAKKVTWPLATVFAGLFNPTEYTCVKPTAFGSQAATFGLSADKAQAVNAQGYDLFRDVALRTQTMLRDAGHKPRDLMDVYTFIWRTHAFKPAA